jgi:hypothetical protein
VNGKQAKSLRRIANELRIDPAIAKKCYLEAIRIGAAGKRATLTHAILAGTVLELRNLLFDGNG